jgi:hypothetical protein
MRCPERLLVMHDLWQIDVELMCKASLARSRPVTAIREALETAAE